MNPIHTTTLLAATLLGASAHAGPVTYRVDPIVGDSGFTCSAMNTRGDVAGSDGGTDSTLDAVVVTKNGAVRRSGAATGGPSSVATAIDDHRMVAGWIVSVPSEDGHSPVVWTHDGKHHRLPTVGAYGQGEAHGMNNHGDIVGWASPQDGGAQYATLWRHGKRINLTPGGGGLATAINDAGQVVGYSGVSEQDAALFENGTITLMGQLGSHYSVANAISSNGHAAGYAYLAGNANQHAFYWAGGAMQDLGAPAGTNSFAYGVNASDFVVGQAVDSTTFAGTGLVWIGGTMYTLDSLLDPATGAGWTMHSGNAIDDAGHICASGNLGAAMLTPM